MSLTDSEIDAVLEQAGYSVPPADKPMFRDAARDMRAMCERVRAIALEAETIELFSINWPKPEERR